MIARRLSHAYGGYAGAVALRRVGYGLFYLLGDHLGSTSVLVNQDGTPAAFAYYYPYGGNRGGALNPLTAKRFTGQSPSMLSKLSKF